MPNVDLKISLDILQAVGSNFLSFRPVTQLYLLQVIDKTTEVSKRPVLVEAVLRLSEKSGQFPSQLFIEGVEFLTANHVPFYQIRAGRRSRLRVR